MVAYCEVQYGWDGGGGVIGAATCSTAEGREGAAPRIADLLFTWGCVVSWRAASATVAGLMSSRGVRCEGEEAEG